MSGSLTSKPPSGLLRYVLQLPLALYRIGLGELLGRRFMLLNHVRRLRPVPGAFQLITSMGPGK